MQRLAAVASLITLVGGSPVAGAPAPASSPPRFAPFDLYGSDSYESVVVGDFTSDGRTDVAVTTSYTSSGIGPDQLIVFAQTGPGRLAERVRQDISTTYGWENVPTAADVDADGDLDIVVAGGDAINVHRQFLGGIQPAEVIPYTAPKQVAVADVTRDGVVDLVVSAASGVVVLRGTGGGQFSSVIGVTATYYGRIEVGDVTGDGVLDLVGLGHRVTVHPGKADGAFGPAATYDYRGTDPIAIAENLVLGDLNGDGRTDVAVMVSGLQSARASVLVQKPDGTLAPFVAANASYWPQQAKAADMNLDGRTDLVVAHGGGMDAGVLSQTAAGTLGAETRYRTPYSNLFFSKFAMDVGDVSGDGLPDIVIVSNDYGLLVLRSAGQVQTWGLGANGQLGNGTTFDVFAPIPAIELPPVATLAAGGYHNLAVARNGTVWAWGLNNAGQLGDGTYASRLKPVKLATLSGVVSAAGGTVHSAAVRSDGTVWTWGWNHFGQLGLGTTAVSNVPVQVPVLGSFVSVAAGLGHTLALASDGSVWAWGLNHVGQLGVGTTLDSSVPVRLLGISDVVAIAAGAFHSLAVTSDGRVWSWGLNQFGQLGTGSSALYEPGPQGTNLSGVRAVAAGAYHSVALDSSAGYVHTWGLGTEGELGTGEARSSEYPRQALGLSGVKAVAAGWYHTLATTETGTTYAWGWNHFGQLGKHLPGDALSPVEVAVAPVLLGAGVAHSVAVTAR